MKKIFQSYRYDISLTEDSGSKLLPWLIGLMVYMITLCLAITLAISNTTDKWRNNLSGNATVEISAQKNIDMAEKMREISAFLENEPAVVSATPVDQSDMMKLVEPWLGDITTATLSELPLPGLIDVQFYHNEQINIALLKKKLELKYPFARLDNHQTWQNNMQSMARVIEIGILSLTLIMIALSSVVIIGSIKSNMAIHRDEISLLHLMGAYDSYITKQFQQHALRSVLKGSCFGTLLALISFVIIVQFILGLNVIGSFGTWEWGIISLLPIILGGLVSFFTTRIITKRELLELA